MHKYIEKMVAEGLLRHIDDHPLGMENGVIMVGCGDCDKFYELIDFAKMKCKIKVGHERIHQLTLNGGALGIHPDSPVNQAGKSAVFIFDIGETNPMKEIEDLDLYAHFICGKAKGLNLSIEEHFLWLALAGVYCLQQFPHMRIACKFHVDANTDTPFKTYYFDHLAWLLLYDDKNFHTTASA